MWTLVRCSLNVLGIVLIAVLNTGAGAQDDASRQSITDLIGRFSAAAMSGHSVAEFFTPEAQRNEGNDIREMNSKSFQRFAITDFTPASIDFQDSRHASLRATITWETNNESASKITTIRFVNENGTWYFADAGFWQLNFVWFTPFIAYGIAYGVGVVVMLWHIHKVAWIHPRQRLLWELLSIVPATLPFYFSRRPWVTSQSLPDGGTTPASPPR